MKKLTRRKLVEDFISKIEDIGFKMTVDNEKLKNYVFFGKNTVLFFNLSKSYTIEISYQESTFKDTFSIRLTENKPLFEKSTDKITALFTTELKMVYISPLLKGVTMEQEWEKINNLITYIYNIDKVKQSLRKKKLGQINGRLGTKVQGTSSTHIRVE